MKKMNKLVALILAALMIATSIPFAFASDEETIYTSGDYTYTLNEDGEALLETYTGTEENVTVPAVIDGYPVRELQYEMFGNNITVKNVVVSEGIRYVGGRVFTECAALETVVIPDSVLELGYDSNVGAFSDCPNLKKVTLGKNLCVFKGVELNLCPSLEELIIPEENPYYVVEDLVVYSKNKKTLVNFLDYSAESFTVPDGVRVIGSEAFSGAKIKEIKFNDDLLYVAYFAFFNCDNLTEVVFPNSVNEFGRFIFRMCDSLTNVTLPESAVNISDGMLDECFKLKDVYVPAETETVAQEAFYNWTYDIYDYKVVPEINFRYGGSEAEWEALNVDTRETAPNVYYNHTHNYNCTDTVSECAECGLTYSNSHAWKITEVVYPENGVDGYIDLVCSTDASHTKREVLSADAPLTEMFYNGLKSVRKIYLETDWIDSFKEIVLEEYAKAEPELAEYIYGEHYAGGLYLKDIGQNLEELEGIEQYIKPDYSEYDALIAELEAASEAELLDSAKSSLDSIKAAVEEIRANGENSAYEYQATVDAYVAELEAIVVGVKDGTFVKADYSEIDEALKAVDEALENATISEEIAAELAEIKAELEELKKNSDTSKAELENGAYLEKIEEIAEKINDSTKDETDSSCPDCGRNHDNSFIQNLICLIVQLIKLVKAFVLIAK